AGVLGKSLYRLLHVDVGLKPDRLVTMSVDLPPSVYGTNDQVMQVRRTLLGRVASLPGVASAGTTSRLPISNNGFTTWFRVLGRPWHGEHDEAPERYVSPGYFATIGATLVRGRQFTDQDGPPQPSVAIVNRAFERRYFPGEDPLGRTIAFLGNQAVPIEIVGIVDDIREGPLGVAIPPVLYFPSTMNPNNGFGLTVRTSHADPSIAQTVSTVISDLDS